MTLIECVPNFSEGRNKHTLGKITKALTLNSKVHLLGSESGESVNRSVFTFVGEPDAVIKSAYEAISVASELIDMQVHQGVHPRMGACDVCPLIPLDQKKESMEICIEASFQLAKMVGENLGIPVYLYGESASHEDRRELALLRRGGYEGLLSKMQDEKYAPDFGPSIFNARSGATAIGARAILVAYNISLNTTSLSIAEQIAKQLRLARKSNENELKAVKAMGWVIDDHDFKCAQISMNLVDYQTTGMYEVFQKVKREAKALGVDVTGSEVVGLVPLACLLDVGRKVSRSYQGGSQDELVKKAIDFLGLNLHYPFEPEAKILDFALNKL
ncbi:MAG: glutamate formimidoyltransferase [Candidatus Melainabacteria bacterium]|nr:glutamate formimidoyltransferase [Candidatus Melainabacteria bacterium]